ncbi:chitin synthase-domain-containing protein [Mycena galopus ATCC 62051]|nr:chitin synthase-domain-containing protein [Mycena galopus ATCC 62051]
MIHDKKLLGVCGETHLAMAKAFESSPINSTVHNLGELVFIEQLCGFCCFSMRFVVMIDLVSTLTLSVTVAYIPYLFYLVFGEHDQIQIISLVMIVAVYVSFYLPFYSFWRMDDFSLRKRALGQGIKSQHRVLRAPAALQGRGELRRVAHHVALRARNHLRAVQLLALSVAWRKRRRL